jgi:phage protein D
MSNDDLAPNFEVAVAGNKLGTGISDLVQSVEYESADGVVDEARVTLANPDYILCDSPLWQPGNELDIWCGYGTQLSFIGRVIICKPELSFVQDGMPTITIKGYTKDILMTQNKPKDARPQEESITQFEVFQIDQAIERIAACAPYNFKAFVDPTPNRNTSPQKSDMSDFEFVKGLANLVGYLFWVDYNEVLGWCLYFVNPDNRSGMIQDKKYTFEHAVGSCSLLEFRPELALTGAVTRLQVQSRNPLTDELYVEEFDDLANAPDVKYQGDPSKVVDETHTTAGAVVRLMFGDYAVDVITDKKFSSAVDMKVWAQEWFKRKRENFVMGRGSVIGIEDLRARQTHSLTLPSMSLTGDYYFSRVAHKFDRDSGYTCDFTARKILA